MSDGQSERTRGTEFRPTRYTVIDLKQEDGIWHATTCVRLPPYSPHLNPIEQVWKTLKRDLSPLSAESGEKFRELIRESFQTFTERLSFAADWINRFLDIQKL